MGLLPALGDPERAGEQPYARHAGAFYAMFAQRPERFAGKSSAIEPSSPGVVGIILVDQS